MKVSAGLSERVLCAFDLATGFDRLESLQNARNLTSVYKVVSANRSFVIKASRQDRVDAIVEQQLCERLQRDGFQDFAPALRVYTDPDTRVQWTLYPYVPGTALDVSTFHEHAASVGRLLARYHAASRPQLQSADRNAPVATRDAFSELCGMAGERCVVHGDFRADNILLTPAGSLVLTDFEFHAPGYPALDLATCRVARLSVEGFALASDACFADIVTAYDDVAQDSKLRAFCGSAAFNTFTGNLHLSFAKQIQPLDADLAQVLVKLARHFGIAAQRW